MIKTIKQLEIHENIKKFFVYEVYLYNYCIMNLNYIVSDKEVTLEEVSKHFKVKQIDVKCLKQLKNNNGIIRSTTF